MRKRRTLGVLFILLLLCGGIFLYNAHPFGDFAPEETTDMVSVGTQTDDLPPVDMEPADPVEELLSTLTLEEKVGQLFLVRCPAENALDQIAQYHLGGYVLFGRDFAEKTDTQVKDMLSAYQAAARIPLLLATDEEGGTVVRLSANPQLFPTRFSSPQTLYEKGGLTAVAQDAAMKNAALRQYGINVNLGPVADVSTNPSDFIYDRTLGLDADSTAAYVTTVVDAMADVQVGSVLKHFPGYGGCGDTHTDVIYDDRSLAELETVDFVPFKAGAEAGADAIMVAHMVVEAVDADLPASLSPAVHTLLRESIGFDGVIMTDDLAMEGAAAFDSEETPLAVQALLAGNDIILTTDFVPQMEDVLDAVHRGTLSEEHIDASVRRVLRWKQELGLLKQ